MSFNRITIVGNLGKDPELMETSQGTSVCNFTVATNSGKEEPTWFRVTVWRKHAENCAKYLKKGSKVYVDGTLSVENWDGERGEKMITLRVEAKDVHFLGERNEQASLGAEEDVPEGDMAGVQQAKEKSAPPKKNKDGDIPF